MPGIMAFLVIIIILPFGVMIVGALQDLIQFAAVKPDAPAIGTIVDFYSIFIAHKERFITRRTLHSSLISIIP